MEKNVIVRSMVMGISTSIMMAVLAIATKVVVAVDTIMNTVDSVSKKLFFM